MLEEIIKLRGVTKVYRAGEVEVHALRGIDLEVRRGEFIVVLGPSGSGKSTLLSIIGGVERPTSGSVSVNGVDITHLSDKELTEFRRRNIGFVFQFFNLIPTLTAKENIMLALELRGLRGREAEGEALKLLSEVGLEGKADRFPSELSGGEQQRVAIARALAKNPALLLCDEPTGELDIESGRRVLAVIKRLNREGRTVILVTHNTAIGRLATRVIRLRDGKIAEMWEVREPISVEELSW